MPDSDIEAYVNGEKVPVHLVLITEPVYSRWRIIRVIQKSLRLKTPTITREIVQLESVPPAGATVLLTHMEYFINNNEEPL